MDMKDVRFIPTGIHGILDYSMGVVMSGLALATNFKSDGNDYPAQKYIPVFLALGTTAYSFFTDYELGVIKKIPMKYHLGIDIGSGALLALAPFVIKMEKKYRTAFVGLGIFEILAGLFTKLRPGRGKIDLSKVNLDDISKEELLDIARRRNIEQKFDLDKEDLIRIIRENVQ